MRTTVIGLAAFAAIAFPKFSGPSADQNIGSQASSQFP